MPFQAHLAIDAVGAIALAATPFVTGQFKEGPARWFRMWRCPSSNWRRLR
jgi:hypothetical protein